jgi:hypothetical protein
MCTGLFSERAQRSSAPKVPQTENDAPAGFRPYDDMYEVAHIPRPSGHARYAPALPCPTQPSGVQMYIRVTLPQTGWIGSWSAGIGDPTVGGWVTTFLYFATVVQLWRVAQRIDRALFEWTVWRVLLVCMLALGINKQLKKCLSRPCAGPLWPDVS